MRTATFAVSVAVICGGSLPVTAGPPTVGYELNASSAYSAGCFGNPGQVPQCQCAILLALDFIGTFGLTPVPGEPGFDTFGVSDIEWTASLQDDVVITGSGTYEIATDASGNPVQRMTLELMFNGGDTVAFDSGLVAGGGGFPDVIEIPISDDFGCPGTRITMGAGPSANPADCAPAGGDGIVGIQDLLAVIGEWGMPGPRPTDIDGSGFVDIGDFLAVLGAWT